MGKPSPFADAIEQAARRVDFNVAERSADIPTCPVPRPKEQHSENDREVQAEATAAFAALAKTLGDKFGRSIIYQQPRVSRKRTRAEYEFWQRPVMAFIEIPNMLDLGPTALARHFGSNEPSFAVTKDTFRAPLSKPARKAAGTLLKSRGYNLKLPSNFSIRDIQKAMKNQQDRAKGVEKFTPLIEVVGDTIICDGKSFKMQPTASGKRRIRVGNGWLSIDRLIAFLSGAPNSD